MRDPMFERTARPYLVLALLLLWALTAQLTYSGYILYVEANARKLAEIPVYTDYFSNRVSQIPAEYAASGLQVGDHILTINGEPLEGETQFAAIRNRMHPGDTVVFTVDRDIQGRHATVRVPVLLKRVSPEWARAIFLSSVLPLSCLLVGFYIVFARPRDPLAWITLAMLACIGQAVGSGASWSIPSPWRENHFVYHAWLSNFWPFCLVLFALYFPLPFTWWRKYKWFDGLLAVPALVLACFELYGYMRAGMHLNELGWLNEFFRRTHTAINILYTVYVSAFFLLLGFKQGLVKTPDARRRLSVMSMGCTLALLPLLPVVFLNLPDWANTVLLIMVLFFPLTMAYVIVVQRAMDVRMVVRSGVRYALASNTIRVLRVILVTALVLVTIELEQQSSHRWEGILIAAIGVLLIVTVGRAARTFSHWMDRRFFREAYNAELILTELGHSIGGIRDTKTLLQTITQRLADSLHVNEIAVLLDRNRRLEPAYAVGFGSSVPPVTLPRDSATVRLLKDLGAPSRIYFDDPQSWVHATPETEQETLHKLKCQLLLPVTLNGRVFGLISLGAKKSEAPYSQADLQLLGAVASQTGLALENAELTESIRKEVAQRERLDRELEIARDVQQRLFPQKLPAVQGLDFAGYCRPAYGVGGDYYDFVCLPGDCLGIAVGDVSGKGIAAALLMASLQASLRGQTIKPSSSLSEMMRNINRLVYDASAENRYATFFYAQYDPHNRLLRYVNAGHNPPLVYRRNSRPEMQHLEEGGTVIGLFQDFPYQEGRVALESGDLLIAFTDGISEAMNSSEDEYGEDRLISALRDCKARTAADLISELLVSVDSFTAGARQHDDMTLVVVRVQ